MDGILIVSGVPETTNSPSIKVIQVPLEPILYCTSKYALTVPVLVRVTVGVEEPPLQVPGAVSTVPAA